MKSLKQRIQLSQWRKSRGTSHGMGGYRGQTVGQRTDCGTEHGMAQYRGQTAGLSMEWLSTEDRPRD